MFVTVPFVILRVLLLYLYNNLRTLVRWKPLLSHEDWSYIKLDSLLLPAYESDTQESQPLLYPSTDSENLFFISTTFIFLRKKYRVCCFIQFNIITF